jgi:hypothetical protein
VKREVILLGKRRNPGSPREQWPGAELWGTTSSNQKYAKKHGEIRDWTSWWDLHPVFPTPFYKGIKALRPETYRWYQGLPGPGHPKYRPVWMLEIDPTIPASVAFPWREVLEWARQPEGGAWFTCQVDWMMAWALHERYEHIILHGHGVSREFQHMAAHRGILHWVAVARERGCKVTIIPPSWYIAPEQPYGVAAGGLGVRR